MREHDHRWQVPAVESPDPVADAHAAERAEEAARRRRASGWLAAAYVVTALGVWWVNNEANFHDQLASRGRRANGVVTEIVSERRHRRLRWDYALKYRYEVRGALIAGMWGVTLWAVVRPHCRVSPRSVAATRPQPPARRFHRRGRNLRIKAVFAWRVPPGYGCAGRDHWARRLSFGSAFFK